MDQDPFQKPRKRLARVRYLVAVPVPWYQDADGQIWLDHLWWHDLAEHLNYLSDLTILAPRVAYDPDIEGLIAVPEAAMKVLNFAALPAFGSTKAAVLGLPRTFLAARRAVQGADVVHSGIAGWPIPPGFLVNPLAWIYRKKLVINIESAFWRLAGDTTAGLGARVRASWTETFARWSVRRAALAMFSQSAYFKELSDGATGKMIVDPAVWISEDDILPEAEANAIALAASGPVKLLLAARLNPEKGVQTALDAMDMLCDSGVDLQLDVIGRGRLEGQVQERAGRDGANVRYLEPVSYGSEFFELVRGYDAVLVPSLSDEQPRIVFDAFAQAVPVIASATTGHQEVVSDKETGWLFAPGDADGLAKVLMAAASGRAELQAMRPAALGVARAHTHRKMHLRRSEILADLFGEDQPD